MIKDFEFISTRKIEDVHKYLRTNKFWADFWALGLIEKELNYKFIILSEVEYKFTIMIIYYNVGYNN